MRPVLARIAVAAGIGIAASTSGAHAASVTTRFADLASDHPASAFSPVPVDAWQGDGAPTFASASRIRRPPSLSLHDAPAIPEPPTQVLIALGLLGSVVTARRRLAQER